MADITGGGTDIAPEEQDSRQRYSGEIGAAAWIDSIGGWTTPLLGGFSLASVVAVASNTGAFRWPGAAILALAIAALVLILTVQTAQSARRPFAVRADLPTWGKPDDQNSKPRLKEEAYREREEALVQAKIWRVMQNPAFDPPENLHADS
jgi:hypothetical protein